MTLDEAINHLDETLEDDSRIWSCEECKQEHVQLREWLIELKGLREVQKPRVMMLEEVNRHCAKHDPVEISDNQPLYVEYKNNRPWFLHWATVETLESWVIDIDTRAEYGKKWRCWTSRPTDEQREAEPWN